ncbi:MAG: PAS domain S-box protein [Pseudomonadota bacterium]
MGKRPTDRSLEQGGKIPEEAEERRRADKALKENEEKYRILVENANEAILVAQDGMLKFVNPKVTEISGYTREELTSKAFIDFIHPHAMTGRWLWNIT